LIFGEIELALKKAAGVLPVASPSSGGFQTMSLWLIETCPQFGQVGV
jgi:hypothetical protein